jgi:beta-galactosidase/beta-glucuronidase
VKPSVADSDKRVYLRINGLHTVARVWVNGKDAGHLWASPWEVDVTDCLQAGENKVSIEVANQLTNRMIGDMLLPEEQRTTFATTTLVKVDDTLLPAGITEGVEWVIR